MQSATTEIIETDRRSFQRTPVALFGRCLFSNDIEIPCHAINISPGDAGLIAAHSPMLGDHVIVYLDHVGRIEGNAFRLFDGGFAMLINGTSRKREKLAARIEWVKAHKEFHLDDNRRENRIVPRQTNSQLKMPDGRTYPVEIIDISLSGAAIAIDVKPALGNTVWLAGMEGIVIRHMLEGIAIRFSGASNRSGLVDMLSPEFS